MDSYDSRLAPKAFGQNNTGVICYLNSFLQMLAGCTAWNRAVLMHSDYLRRTATGTAIVNFVTAYATQTPEGPVAREQVTDGIELLSAAVLRALVSDLAVRRPHVQFGGGQESASEALVHLLDMMEPPRSDPPSRVEHEPADSPITSLFIHRFRCEVHCQKCKGIVSKTTDYAVNFNLFHLSGPPGGTPGTLNSAGDTPGTLNPAGDTPGTLTPPDINHEIERKRVAAFSKSVRIQASATENYRCPVCPCGVCGGAPIDGRCPTCKTPSPPTAAIRIYNLTMVPEIILGMFNLYGIRHAQYFPHRLEFPAHDGTLLVYNLVGQVEHAGTLSGGHYWAHGLRADGRVYLLNDTGVSPSFFTPTPNTYIVAYHYAGRE